MVGDTAPILEPHQHDQVQPSCIKSPPDHTQALRKHHREPHSTEVQVHIDLQQADTAQRTPIPTGSASPRALWIYSYTN